MRSQRLEYTASFDFILSDEQRAVVERTLSHEGVGLVRWVKYPRKEFDTVVVEFRPCQNTLAIADVLSYVHGKLACLDASLDKPVTT